MLVNNGNRGEKQVKFYPPSAELFLMGPDPPTQLPDSFRDGATDQYFRNYKHETISRVIMPRYDWDENKIPYFPVPDSAGTKTEKHEIIVPKHDISNVNQVRMKEVDDIYKAVQLQRAQYKDRTGRLHPLIHFVPDRYKYRSAPALSTSYFTRYPTRYTEYKTPSLFSRSSRRPDFFLSGVSGRYGCVKFDQ